MIVVLLVNLAAILFAFLEGKKVLRNGLVLSFVLIFVFLALRYGYGNDYFNYLRSFEAINRHEASTLLTTSLRFEPGWILLCRLFKPLGFYSLVAFLALLNCFFYYSFIKRHVAPPYYWLAIFVYTFTASLMMTQLSAMRQALAIGIFLFSLRFLIDRKYLLYLGCIVISWAFHVSAIILLPLILLRAWDFKLTWLKGVGVAALYLLLFITTKKAATAINYFIDNYFTQYSIYQNRGGEVSSGIGLAVFFVLLMFGVLSHLKERGKDLLFMKIFVIAILLIPLSIEIMMISRVNFYLMSATVAVYPAIYQRLKPSLLKYTFLFLVMGLCLYSFYIFFTSDIWGESISEYRTIFSAI